MLKIGITGGIGSGKSTACLVFEKLGIPVYYSDTRAKELMIEDQELIASIKAHFGNEVYSGSILNNKVLASIVFADKNELKILNDLVHPAVGRDYKNWLSQYKNENYTLKEAALLYEAGIYKELDKVIVVTCPLETRVERVMKRDKVSKEEVMKRVQNQWEEKEKVKLSDYLLDNSGTELLITQVVKLHKEILKLK